MNEIDDKLDEKELQEIAPLREANTELTFEEREKEWHDCYNLLFRETLERKKKVALDNNDLKEVMRLKTLINQLKNLKDIKPKPEEN